MPQSPATPKDEQRRVVLAEACGLLEGSLAARCHPGYYGEITLTVKIVDGAVACVISSASQTKQYKWQTTK